MNQISNSPFCWMAHQWFKTMTPPHTKSFGLLARWSAQNYPARAKIQLLLTRMGTGNSNY